MKSIFIPIFILITLLSTNLNANISREKVDTSPAGCELAGEILVIPVLCNGADDGFAIVNITAGNPPFNFLWSNGETQSSAVELAPGDYSVTVTDGDNCELIFMTTVTEPTTLVANAGASDETAIDANDGIAFANPTGGTSPYGYEWSNAATSDTIFNLSPGEYTVTVTDANECTAIQTVNVNAVECTIEGELLVVPISCNGANDGFAIVNITAGTAPFNFLWSNGETQSSNVELAPGEYSVTVTDGDNCTLIFNTTLTEPAELLANASATDETEIDANDGTASATPTGGTEPFAYVWSNDSTSMTIDNLAPGEYTVTVTDAYSCIAIQTVTVESSGCSLAAEVLVVPVSCFGVADGFAIADITNGTPPYNFLWSNGETQSSAIELVAGTYTLTITDGEECELILTATVTEPAELLANASATNETGIDTNDGTASATPTGGTEPYTYAWSNDSTSAEIINLVPGEYTVTVTDANLCTSSQTVNVTSFDCDLAMEATVSQISCFGECDGEISLAVSGGTAPYIFAWSNDSTSTNLTNLCAGDYTITVTDANECTVTQSFIISEPTLLELSIGSITNASCPESMDGSAIIIATGGTGAYTFAWPNDGTGEGLGGGIYTVTVNDENNCSATIDVEITSTDIENPVAIAQNVSLFLDEGGIAILSPADVNNGSSDNCGIETMSLNISEFNCSQIGMHEVILTVTDASGNSASATAFVTITDIFVPTITCPDSINATACDTEIVYDLPTVFDNCSSGVPTLTAGLASGETFPIGITTVTYAFTDESGNEATCSFDVTVPVVPVVLIESQNVTCSDGADGSINVTVSGDSEYEYLWNNGETTPEITGLPAGVYTLVITDSDACESVVTVSILAPDPIADAIQVTEVIHESNGGANGSIDVTINNLILSPTYAWYLDDVLIAETEDLESLSTGDYTLIVTDANGCEYTSEVITVDNINGVNTPTVNAGFALSPNPTSGLVFITIDHDFATTADIQVWDVLGQNLLILKEIKAGDKEFQLDFSAFSSGTYFVQLNTDKGTFVRKVVR